MRKLFLLRDVLLVSIHAHVHDEQFYSDQERYILFLPMMSKGSRALFRGWRIAASTYM